LVLTDTKTAEAQDVPLHPWVGEFLTTFIVTYRPLLSAGASHDEDHLWLCQDGTPLQATGLRALFRRVGFRLLGHPLSPHRLRHAGATFLLKRAPREITRAAALLTHRSARTTGAAYDVGGPEPALRLWRGLVKDTARKGRV
jgi:site-specific recombinase XerD